ncbi:MAG: hypothetical protein R2939_09715 [Kofleriaceae bacterium]
MARSTSIAWAWVLGSVAACVVTTPPPTPARGPTPATEAPAPTTIVAEAPCEVAYELTAQPTPTGVRLVATAHNLTQRAVRLRAPSRCPAGPVAFFGLPAGYDVDGTCAMGACLDHAPVEIEVAPGASVVLAEPVLDWRGDACNPPLPSSSFELSFAPLPLADGAPTCAPAPVSVRAPAPAPATIAPPPSEAPPPAPAPRCQPMPACGIGCPGPMARDADGCPLCACADDVGPGVRRGPTVP